MLEIIATILLILIAVVIVVWIGVFIVGLVIANKARKRITSQFENDPFFRDTNPVRSRSNWRDHNGF